MPEVLQSGFNFGVNFFILVRRMLGDSRENFSANFDGELFTRVFRPCFSRISGPPPPKKNSRPEIVGISLQYHFLEPTFFHADFLLTGKIKRCFHLSPPSLVGHFSGSLDGRNRSIVIAELLARVIVAIRIANLRWRSYLPLKTQK